ncbi:hypothetical protein C1645_814939 [Glomus cerebriforme]|uniref:Uncharacterized protein n=1 Tax=Glomus cerebriforme TaxID=658196 RepID=A0A397THB0_9GLOM|nr:hypothetical protein C1645_814939 [Glomus cerebriforme]
MISRMENRWKDCQLQIINENKEELIIVNDDNDDEDINDTTEGVKKDEGKLNTEENENQWNTIISWWIEEANYKNWIKNNDVNIHPADDPDAKWKLETLFMINLELSIYTGFFFR